MYKYSDEYEYELGKETTELKQKVIENFSQEKARRELLFFMWQKERIENIINKELFPVYAAAFKMHEDYVEIYKRVHNTEPTISEHFTTFEPVYCTIVKAKEQAFQELFKAQQIVNICKYNIYLLWQLPFFDNPEPEIKK